MSADDFYPASPIKRVRSTKAEVETRRRALFEIVQRVKPATVRQVFYQATVRGIVEKTEGGYEKVQTDLVLMRRRGELPYGWLADNTRWQRKPRSYAGIAELLEETAKHYRRDLWKKADCYVEIWLEKDALSGMIFPITAGWDIPLMVARGYASLSFLYSAAEFISELDVPTYIYHLGDYDPSGQDAARAIEKTLRELAPGSEIHFKRLAVTPEQIDEFHLPSRLTKKSDSRARNFGSDISVELDAINPEELRTILECQILEHVSDHQVKILTVVEESEREILKMMADDYRAAI